MMKKRVISGAVLIAALLLFVFLSKITRVLFFYIAAMMCAWELSTNLERMNVGCQLSVAAVYLSGHALLTIFYPDVPVYCIWFIAYVFLAMVCAVFRKDVKGGGTVVTIAALGYPCLQFAILMSVSVGKLWLETLVLACLSTWVCDSAALFGGTRYGKHKLAPLVSPNKTWEGFIGGAMGSMLINALVIYFMEQPPHPLFLIGLICAVAGQLGDLAESLLKRELGEKDSGQLIPGHGGVLDRFDSILINGLLTYLIFGVAM